MKSALQTTAALAGFMAILAIVSYGSHAYSVTNSGDRQQALEHTRDNEEKIAGAMARLIEEPDREIPQDWNIFCKERPFNKTMEDQEGITVQVCQFSVLTGGNQVEANYLVEMDNPGRNWLNNLLRKEPYPIQDAYLDAASVTVQGMVKPVRLETTAGEPDTREEDRIRIVRK